MSNASSWTLTSFCWAMAALSCCAAARCVRTGGRRTLRRRLARRAWRASAALQATGTGSEVATVTAIEIETDAIENEIERGLLLNRTTRNAVTTQE